MMLVHCIRLLKRPKPVQTNATKSSIIKWYRISKVCASFSCTPSHPQDVKGYLINAELWSGRSPEGFAPRQQVGVRSAPEEGRIRKVFGRHRLNRPQDKSRNINALLVFFLVYHAALPGLCFVSYLGVSFRLLGVGSLAQDFVQTLLADDLDCTAPLALSHPWLQAEVVKGEDTKDPVFLLSGRRSFFERSSIR